MGGHASSSRDTAIATENNCESLTKLCYQTRSSSASTTSPAPMANLTHLQKELSQNNDRISVVTQYGPVTGGRTSNGVAVFLGDLFDVLANSAQL